MSTYAEDLEETIRRNRASLAACRSMHARKPLPELSRHIAHLEDVIAEHTDPAHYSASGAIYHGRPNSTIEEDLAAIVEIAGRKMVEHVRGAFAGRRGG